VWVGFDLEVDGVVGFGWVWMVLWWWWCILPIFVVEWGLVVVVVGVPVGRMSCRCSLNLVWSWDCNVWLELIW